METVSFSRSDSRCGAALQVALQISEAVSQGARVVRGGRRLDGSFVEPTLLTQVTPSMLCMKEETFGPLVPILRSVVTSSTPPPITGLESSDVLTNQTR